MREADGRPRSESAWIMLCGAALVCTGAALAAEPPATGAPEAEKPAAPDQVVKVEEATADDDIAARLAAILDTTGWFESPGVEVRNGVAFLSGRTERESYRTWAGELAMKTEGVAAVANGIQVRDAPVWDLRPARRELESLWRESVQSLPLVGLGLVVLVLTMLLSRGVARLMTYALVGRMQNRILRGVAEKAVLALVIVFGAYIFLRVSGLTRVALTLLGGTGVAGLVIGFAFRDIAENFLASLLLSVQRPFQLGDMIEVGGQTGIVQRVTTRGTLLIDPEGNHIQIANATIYKNTIRNFTANPNRRLDFAVPLENVHGISRAQEAILDVLAQHSAVLSEPAPLVLVETLNPAGVTLRVYFWIDGVAHGTAKVKSAVMRLTLRALQSVDETARLTGPSQGIAPTGRSGAPGRPGEPALEVTRAEGALRSDAAELERQAQRGRVPEEGANLLDPQVTGHAAHT